MRLRGSNCGYGDLTKFPNIRICISNDRGPLTTYKLRQTRTAFVGINFEYLSFPEGRSHQLFFD